MQKLSEDNVNQLRETYCVSEEDFQELAKELGLTFMYAVNVARGRRYTDIPMDKSRPGYRDSLDKPILSNQQE